jgi:hypothetical protein
MPENQPQWSMPTVTLQASRASLFIAPGVHQLPSCVARRDQQAGRPGCTPVPAGEPMGRLRLSSTSRPRSCARVVYRIACLSGSASLSASLPADRGTLRHRCAVLQASSPCHMSSSSLRCLLPTACLQMLARACSLCSVAPWRLGRLHIQPRRHAHQRTVSSVCCLLLTPFRLQVSLRGTFRH